MPKGAKISTCNQYRYQLWRIWDDTKPCVLFVMLNPSTADASIDDPTLRRCMGFAKSWGYGGVYIGNLYAYRATNPSVLQQVAKPVGSRNKSSILKMVEACDKIICAWGNNLPTVGSPIISILKKQPRLYHLGLTKRQQPRHPLYVKGNTIPELFSFK